MKALRLHKPDGDWPSGELSLDTNYAEPSASDGLVRVRVTQAGICETDLQLVAGYMGFSGVIGHEFVGVAESGQFERQRVVGEINCICRQCDYCIEGLGNHCPHRTVIGILNHDGAFADYLLVPEANLHVVPDSMTDDLATLVEPIAAAMQIETQVALRPGMKTAVVGDGRLGFLCAQALRQAGCDVTIVGKHADKLATFTAIDFAACTLSELAAERVYQLVVDCSGSKSGLETAMSIVRPCGTLVMKTTVAAKHEVALAPVVIDEITIVGSRCGPFDKAIEAIRDERFHLDNFISGRFPLESYREAFARAMQPDALKVILEM